MNRHRLLIRGGSGGFIRIEIRMIQRQHCVVPLRVEIIPDAFCRQRRILQMQRIILLAQFFVRLHIHRASDETRSRIVAERPSAAVLRGNCQCASAAPLEFSRAGQSKPDFVSVQHVFSILHDAPGSDCECRFKSAHRQRCSAGAPELRSAGQCDSVRSSVSVNHGVFCNIKRNGFVDRRSLRRGSILAEISLKVDNVALSRGCNSLIQRFIGLLPVFSDPDLSCVAVASGRSNGRKSTRDRQQPGQYCRGKYRRVPDKPPVLSLVMMIQFFLPFMSAFSTAV